MDPLTAKEVESRVWEPIKPLIVTLVPDVKVMLAETVTVIVFGAHGYEELCPTFAALN